MALNNRSAKLTSLGFVLTIAAGATPAYAQQANDPAPPQRSAKNLQTIVVKAEKKSERLQDVPVPVTVIQADSLDERNETKLQDYFATVPGLSLNAQGNGQASLAIRGITTGALTTPAVGITIDDVPFGSSTALGYGSRFFPDIDPSDLSQIEVLRGPQGTLYGSSSLGGLIKVETTDPDTSSLYGRVEMDGSSVTGGGNGYGARGAVNIPLSSTIALRASAFTRQDPGYVNDPALGRKDVNSAEAKGARLSGLWTPSDAFSLKLSALSQTINANGTSEVDANYRLQPTLGDLNQNRLLGTGAYSTKAALYSATATAGLGSMTLTSVSGYGISKYTGSIDESLEYGPLASSIFKVSGAALVNDFETKKFSQEIRLASAIDQTVEWLVGGFYTHEKTPADQQILAVDPSTGISPGVLADSPYPTTYSELAAFGNLTVHFTSQFDVQFGARESQDKQTYSETDTGPLVGGVFVNPSARTKANALTYLVTPRFKLSTDLMAYARIASGYRAGGPNPDASLFDLPLSYKPDKTVNYELGVKGELLDRRLSFDASLYHIDWSDVQIQLRDPTTGLAYFSNGGKARSDGAELTLKSHPFDGLTIAGTVSIGEAKLTQDLPPSAGVGFSGDRLPYSSKISGSLSIDQDIPISSGVIAFVGAATSYVGNRYGDFAPATGFYRAYLPGYASVDLHTGAIWDSWRITLFVKNVTDRRGILGGGPRGLSGATPADPFYVNYIQPRTIGVSISDNF